MLRIRTLAFALIVATTLAASAILAVGLHRLPGPGELTMRYRAAGLPPQLSEVNPNLLAALDAEQPRLAPEFSRMECAGPARGLARHAIEAICTFTAKVAYSDDSLRLWRLNSAYYGRAAFGVVAGAQGWFGKDQRDLTPAEAALLVALTRQPAAADNRLRRMLDRLADRMQIPEDAREQAMTGIIERR